MINIILESINELSDEEYELFMESLDDEEYEYIMSAMEGLFSKKEDEYDKLSKIDTSNMTPAQKVAHNKKLIEARNKRIAKM